MRIPLLAILALTLVSGAQARGPASHSNPPAHLGAPGLFKLLVPAATLKHPQFDAAGFKARFENDMKNDGVPNYIVEIRANGKTIFLDKSGYAQMPGDGGEPWAVDVPMHIGSVSKLITAMAMVKLIDSLQNPSTNPTPYRNLIANYLPAYWTRGPGLSSPGNGQVDFRHLLLHHSGFTTSSQQEFQPDYQTMRQVIAAGSDDSNAARYQNVNYSLMRVLLAVLNGNVDKNHVFSSDAAANDAAWDSAAIAAYVTYVQSKVFAPSMVTAATLSHTPTTALAYDAALTTPGWNSGDLSTYSGCAGWHMSIDALLDTMGTFMRGGTIVTPAEALGTLMLGYGIDNTQNSQFGPVYAKGGDDFDDAGHMEQAAAMFVPSVKIEAAAFVNMPMGNGQSAEGVLVNDFLASIKEASPFGDQDR